MVVSLPRDSHKNKQKYQIDYEDAARLLGPDFKVVENGELPVKKSTSKFTIIGGGFGGIATSLKILKTLNSEDFVIFEKYNNFGGTWLVNTYPGAASDIPAAWYSFSEELNSNWSCPQPPQYEIEEYILKVVGKYQLTKYAIFNTIVTQCKWIEHDQNWEITATDLNSGQKTIHKSQFIINCIGGLAQVNHFHAPGLENFAGNYMHTAIWNDKVDLKNKNVIVVGNGCSATQLIPYLIKDYDVKSVTQIVRSKHYIIPPLPSVLQKLYELFSSTWLGLYLVRMVIIIIGESKWPMFKGDGYISNFVRNKNYQESIDYMNRECPDEYKQSIIPSFTIGCKRLIIDHDYLQTLHHAKMDIKPSTIAKVKPKSVVLQDGTELPADVIIACTGYSVSKTVSTMNYIGRDGIAIKDYWNKEGVSAYNTMLLKHCPNLFVIGGPNHATGHSSVLMAIENGTSYFAKVASKVINNPAYQSVVVKPTKYDEWLETCQSELKKCVFGSKFGGCISWYTEKDHNAVTFPYSQVYYWYCMNYPKYDDLDFLNAKDYNKLE